MLAHIQIYINDMLCFYGISTIVGYLIPNPIFTYMIYKHILWIYALKWLTSSISKKIQFNISQKRLTGHKYFYVSLAISSVICLHTVKCKTVLFQTIQFSIWVFFFAYSLNVKQFYVTRR